MFRRSRKDSPAQERHEQDTDVFDARSFQDEMDDAPLPSDPAAAPASFFQKPADDIAPPHAPAFEPPPVVEAPSPEPVSAYESIARTSRYGTEAATVVGPDTAIEGVIRTAGDVRVDGSVNGTIEIGGALDIEVGGRVDASVTARAVRIEGRLEGDVSCRDRLDVVRGGRIEGKFTTPTLVVEEGAEIQGTFSMRHSSSTKQPSLFGREEMAQ